MPPDTALESLLRRDRAIVAASLVALTVVAWTYTLWLAAAMNIDGMSMSAPGMEADMKMDPAMDMDGMEMGSRGALSLGTVLGISPRPWSSVEAGVTLTMWIVMMVGMMLPSATPMILLYARVGRQSRIAGKPFADRKSVV